MITSYGSTANPCLHKHRTLVYKRCRMHWSSISGWWLVGVTRGFLLPFKMTFNLADNSSFEEFCGSPVWVSAGITKIIIYQNYFRMKNTNSSWAGSWFMSILLHLFICFWFELNILVLRIWLAKTFTLVLVSLVFLYRNNLLQDFNLTWYPKPGCLPDVTPCTEHLVLVWLPCAFLWLTLLPYIVYLNQTRKTFYEGHTKFSLMKSVGKTLLCLSVS